MVNTIRDILNNEELVNAIVEDITEIPEDTPVSYEVWAIGYDCYDDADVELFLKEFSDPDEAIEYAKKLSRTDIVQAADEANTDITLDISRISIEVETVIENEDGDFINIGTIYTTDIYFDTTEKAESEDIVSLTEDDYTILEDGTLKVSRKCLKDFNKNDFVTFCFVNENENASYLKYKIVSTVIYEDGEYYHCEFIY